MEIQAVRFAVYNGKHSGNPPHTSMQNIREKDRHRTRFRHEMNRCTWKHAARSRTNVPHCVPRVAEAQLAEQVWSRTSHGDR